jgi:hypothetical protein
MLIRERGRVVVLMVKIAGMQSSASKDTMLLLVDAGAYLCV